MKTSILQTACSLALTIMATNIISAPITKNVISKISEITVYANRAEVTRTATLSLTAGTYTLSFAGLPNRIDQNSIQVNGTGSALLQDIRFERKQLSDTPDPRVEKLQSKKVSLRDSIHTIEDRINHAQKEKEFVEKIALGLTQPTGKEVPVELDPEKWIKMVTFYRTKMDALSKEIRKLEAVKRDINRELDRLDREIDDLRAGGDMVDNKVLVNVTSSKSGKVTLNLSYIVHGPSWSPLYDIRVNSNTKKMALTYKAQIKQNTTEDWKNVKVKLSTAQPQIGGKQPELYPWHLNIMEHQALRRSRAMAAPVMAKKAGSFELNEMELDDEMQIAPQEMEVATATVKTQTTSAVFIPEGTTSVLSDNQPYTVTITQQEFDAKFNYSAAPKLAQHAYLKATVTNDSEFPFLAGRTNIFLDNSFVATASMDLVAPSEEFETFLGVDEGINVDHKLIKREKKDELGKNRRVSFDYLTIITNTKKTEEELIVWDQIPIANNAEIEVTLSEPKYKEDTPTLKKNESNIFEWHLKLKPGQEIKIPFKFSVRYPKDKIIQGL